MKTIDITKPGAIVKGQRIRVTHTLSGIGSIVEGRIVCEGTVKELYGGPLSGVSFEEDHDGRVIQIVDCEDFTALVENAGWPIDTFVLGHAIIHGTKEDPNGDRVETGERVWRWTGWSWQAADGDDYLRLDTPEIASGQIIFAPSKVLHIPAKEEAHDVDA